MPQEIPDDPARLDPYVAFSHPAGSIIVAAIGNGDHLTWKLNADTVQTARELYIAVEDMPSLSGAAIPAPPSAYFKLRQWVRDQSPALLTAVGLLEVWQILGWAGILVVSFLLALLLSAIILNVLRRLIGGRQQTAERDFRWPLWLSITFSIYKLLIPVIGLPETVKRISVGTTGVLLALALMWGGWRLIDMIGDLYLKRSDGSVAVLDNIVVSLAFGALKLVLVACGLIFIAIELSLPYEGSLPASASAVSPWRSRPRKPCLTCSEPVSWRSIVPFAAATGSLRATRRGPSNMSGSVRPAFAREKTA